MSMHDFTDSQKLELIEKHFERQRRQSGSQSELTVKAEVRIKCGLSRAKAFGLTRGEYLKTPAQRERFEDVFRSNVVAEPGSANYRREWATIQKIVQGTDETAKRHLLGSAVGPWANTALNENKPVTERILVGRVAQYVLHPRHHGKPSRTELDIDPQDAFTCGAKVNAVVMNLLSQNESPPPVMFDHGSPEAKRLGYNMFRIRLLSDQLGWQQPGNDSGRCELFGRAYLDGLGSALMQVGEQLEHRDVSYSYRAFVLATHAGDWARAGEYALTVLKYYPKILTEKVETIKAMLDDPDVWPGVAALIALRWGDIPVDLRDTFEYAQTSHQQTSHQNAIEIIRAMTTGVKSAQSYLDVLKMEKQK